MKGLCDAVAARGGRGGLAGPLVILIWGRLSRMAVRFARLTARVAAGTAAPRRRASPRKATARPRPPYQRLSRRFAWLPPVVPGAAAYGSQLQYLMADPEMAALIAAAPQMGRILRPLCRLLGVRPPPGLIAPPSARSAPCPRKRGEQHRSLSRSRDRAAKRIDDGVRASRAPQTPEPRHQPLAADTHVAPPGDDAADRPAGADDQPVARGDRVPHPPPRPPPRGDGVRDDGAVPSLAR